MNRKRVVDENTRMKTEDRSTKETIESLREIIRLLRIRIEEKDKTISRLAGEIECLKMEPGITDDEKKILTRKVMHLTNKVQMLEELLKRYKKARQNRKDGDVEQ